MNIRILGFLLATCYCPVAFASGVSIGRAIHASNTNDTASRSTTNASNTQTPNVVSRTTATGSSSNSSVRVGNRVVDLASTSSSASHTDNTVKSRGSVGNQSSAKETLATTVATVGRNARVDASSINNNPSVRRAGVSLRPTTAEVGGRAVIAGTDAQTGSNVSYNSTTARNTQSRAATKVATRESIAEATEILEQTATLNKSCQDQYNECMDQFCAVIDSNQKRCSCSSNLSKYTKAEDAVKSANTQLNDVAQRIRYVGLSADEITAIMNETEAEEALSGTVDTSETRNLLSQIEKMIINPTNTSVSYSDDSLSLGLDINLDFSSNSADLFSIDFLNSNNSSSSFSNLRGSQLYNAAKKRCNTVLNQCTNAGATSQQITGNYDLAIDKDCISYEQGLTKMNETLLSNVRSANLMLQKARLAVLQNKNQYDAKGCISALETCMSDEMVCGENYAKCLDPTKIYIDENGDVVLGSDITKISDFMENYNNATIDKTFIQNTENISLTTATCASNEYNNGSCIVKYLMQKIGTGAKATDNGLCRAVLDKCQYYTYTNDSYNKYNDIVISYIQRAMVNVRAMQYRIMSDYASSCIQDVATCYNNQLSQINSWSTNASATSIYNVMTGACKNVALTCGYAIFKGNNNICGGNLNDTDCIIRNISSIYYQSLLCPTNSVYDIEATEESRSGHSISVNGCGDGCGDSERCYINTVCYCAPGYTVWEGQCVKKCARRNSSTGSCLTAWYCNESGELINVNNPNQSQTD